MQRYAFDLAFFEHTASAGMPWLANQLSNIDGGIMVCVLVVALVTLVTGRFSWIAFAAASVLGLLVSSGRIPLDGAMRDVSMNLNFPRPVTDEMFLIIGNAGMALALLLRWAWRRHGSRERLMWAMVAGAVSVTSVVFHLALVNGVLKTLAWDNEEQLVAMLEGELSSFRYGCTFNRMDCRMSTVGPDEAYHHEPYIQRHVANVVSTLPQVAPDWATKPDWQRDQEGRPLTYTFSVSNESHGGPFSAALVVDKEGTYRLAVDRLGMMRPHHAIGLAYFMLCVTAHTIWLGLGLLATEGHRRLFRSGQRKTET